MESQGNISELIKQLYEMKKKFGDQIKKSQSIVILISLKIKVAIEAEKQKELIH